MALNIAAAGFVYGGYQRNSTNAYVSNAAVASGMLQYFYCAILWVMIVRTNRVTEVRSKISIACNYLLNQIYSLFLLYHYYRAYPVSVHLANYSLVIICANTLWAIFGGIGACNELYIDDKDTSQV